MAIRPTELTSVRAQKPKYAQDFMPYICVARSIQIVQVRSIKPETEPIIPN